MARRFFFFLLLKNVHSGPFFKKCGINPSPGFFRTIRTSWDVMVGMGQCDGALGTSELAFELPVQMEV